MKLISARVEKYRIHDDTGELDLDHNLILIHGPNESGKSTFCEAIHRALFLKSKGSANVIKEMFPFKGGDPTVTVKFNSNGKIYCLTKKFGNKGTTELLCPDEGMLHADEAEARLAEILQVEGSLGGGGAEKALPKRWAHLWVAQGESSVSPINSIEQSHDALRSQLQARAGDGISSSQLDNLVINRLEKDLLETFTKSGNKALKHSRLGKIQSQLEDLQLELTEKRDDLQRLETAVSHYEQALADQKRHKDNITAATRQLAGIEKKQEQAGNLKQVLEEKSRQRKLIGQEHQQLIELDQEIRALESELKSTGEKMIPLRVDLSGKKSEFLEIEDNLKQASKSRELIAAERSDKSKASGLLQANLDILSEEKRLAALHQDEQSIKKLSEEENTVRKQIASLEKFTAEAVEELEQKESAVLRTKARLDAFALGVELVSSDSAVSLAGEVLEAGQRKTVTEQSDLKVGDKTCIRLNPGGADDLENARQCSKAAETEFKECLSCLNVESAKHARESYYQYKALSGRLQDLETQIKEADLAKLQTEIQSAEAAIERGKSELISAGVKGIPLDLPNEPLGAKAALEDAKTALRQVEENLESSQAKEAALRDKLEEVRRQQQQLQERLHLSEKIEGDLETRLKMLTSRAGDTMDRAAKLNELSSRLDQITVSEKETAALLDGLNPDQLDLDQERLVRSIENGREKETQTRITIETSLEILKSNGTRDPHSAVKILENHVSVAATQVDSLKKQADIQQFLLNLFNDARRKMVDALSQPLTDALEPYLQILFGESQAKLVWTEDGSRLEGFSIGRSGTVTAFDQLSHGTREQVALVLRLAMAEILADNHDACLPVVLDDAFTHSDDERVEKLKTILYRASQGKLQLILLSCHPERYTSLGAAEINIHSGIA